MRSKNLINKYNILKSGYSIHTKFKYIRPCPLDHIGRLDLKSHGLILRYNDLNDYFYVLSTIS